MSEVPIFITCRDRVSDLCKLVDWLERAGCQRITFLDNASTYEPLLAYYEQTPHTVIRLGENHGSQALWIRDLQPRDEYFVLTDPDIIPTEECPLDAVEHLRGLLDRYPSFQKAALGLYLADVPRDMPSLAWERSLVGIPSKRYPVPRGRKIERGVYDSLSDTTFALHRPGAEFGYQAIRTGRPYQVRHSSWYQAGELSDENRFYLERAASGEMYSSWATQFDAVV